MAFAQRHRLTESGVSGHALVPIHMRQCSSVGMAVNSERTIRGVARGSGIARAEWVPPIGPKLMLSTKEASRSR